MKDDGGTQRHISRLIKDLDEGSKDMTISKKMRVHQNDENMRDVDAELEAALDSALEAYLTRKSTSLEVDSFF